MYVNIFYQQFRICSILCLNILGLEEICKSLQIKLVVIKFFNINIIHNKYINQNFKFLRKK